MILEIKLRSSLACCLSSLQAETRRAFWSSLSSLGTNLAETRHMFKLSAKMRWTVPYDSPAISQTSWIVCLRSARIASRTFAMFSGVVLVDGRPERSFRQTFVRLWSVCTIKKFCFVSWHLRRLPVAFDGFLQQFFLMIETKFDADSLLLKIGHISCKKKNPPDHWNVISQKRTELNNTSSQLNNCWHRFTTHTASHI